MSRGLGKEQRLVLDALRLHQEQADFNHRWLSAYAISHFRTCSSPLHYTGGSGRKKSPWRCESCGGPHEISTAEAESIKRAMRSLARVGLVEAKGYPVLRARLPLTAEEKTRDAEEMAAAQQHADSLMKRLDRHRRRRSYARNRKAQHLRAE